MNSAVKANGMLNQAERIVVITGAGVSTASGIGDYRDDNGAWKRAQPVQHQDFMSSRRWRARYWIRSMAGYPEFLKAVPNKAHHALARLERQGKLLGLITQNVDRLHQQAGQRAAIDLHGRLDEVVCTQCGDVTDRGAWQQWLEVNNPDFVDRSFVSAPDGDADVEIRGDEAIAVPQCAVCAGIVKPNVVFYGDSVPKHRVTSAYAWIESADAVLVAGSSLMVFSSLRFVRRAHERGVPIVGINRGVTRADDLLTAKIEGDCGEILEAYAAQLA